LFNEGKKDIKRIGLTEDMAEKDEKKQNKTRGDEKKVEQT